MTDYSSQLMVFSCLTVFLFFFLILIIYANYELAQFLNGFKSYNQTILNTACACTGITCTTYPGCPACVT